MLAAALLAKGHDRAPSSKSVDIKGSVSNSLCCYFFLWHDSLEVQELLNLSNSNDISKMSAKVL